MTTAAVQDHWKAVLSRLDAVIAEPPGVVCQSLLDKIQSLEDVCSSHPTVSQAALKLLVQDQVSSRLSSAVTLAR